MALTKKDSTSRNAEKREQADLLLGELHHHVKCAEKIATRLDPLHDYLTGQQLYEHRNLFSRMTRIIQVVNHLAMKGMIRGAQSWSKPKSDARRHNGG